MELIRDILDGIARNFASGEGKAIVGGLINLFLLVYMYACIKAKNLPGLLRTAAICLVNSAVFALWASTYPDCPSFLAAFKMLLIAPVIVFGLGAVFLFFTELSGSGSDVSHRSDQKVIYDRYNRPIELKMVNGHYEDSRHDHYSIQGDRAVAETMYLETEDGDTVRVTPEGGGYYSCYGHQYRMNGSGRLEEC